MWGIFFGEFQCLPVNGCLFICLLGIYFVPVGEQAIVPDPAHYVKLETAITL